MLQMTGGSDGVSFTTQGDLPRSQEDMNSNATTTNDGAAAGHSFTTQEEQDEHKVVAGDGDWALQHIIAVGQLGILLPTAQKHLRMHNECWNHPNKMRTNQTSKEHNT